MSRETILVIGAGAREHALAVALLRENPLRSVIVAPGNAGTAEVARNAPVKVDDVAALVDLAVKEGATLVVVGPELPLTLGIVDALAEKGIAAFGPSRAAAELEGSKLFMKRFAKRHGLPTAAFADFADADAADAYIRTANRALVVKADGLAAGKGVVVASNAAEAHEAVDRWMRKGELGDAGRTVVIEELLVGEEASFHVVCDGERFVVLAAAQDHKRVFDGDRGPNTGGMGAYAPAPIVTDAVRTKVIARIVEPTLRGMRDEGRPFRGALFVGLMIDRGEPQLLEFNVRFGDPEATVLTLVHQGWGALLAGAAKGDLSGVISEVKGHALAVVMAAEHYPATQTKGDVIKGLIVERIADAFVFHAGTERTNGEIRTNGGRVLTVAASGESLQSARDAAYARVAQVSFRGEHHRMDIGSRALKTTP